MNRMSIVVMIVSLFASASLASAQAVSRNQRDAVEEELDVLQAWHLTLTPAAEPRPALTYSLWPRYAEQTPGDATPHYYRALLMQDQLPDSVEKEYVEKSHRWLGDKLDEATMEEMRKWLTSYANMIKELRVATYRERIDLDLRLRDLEGLEAIQFLLPDAQETRSIARVLQVKARIEIEDGRFDDAIETLRMGYRLAVFVAKSPTLINDLVGVAIGSLMTAELTRLVAHPDAPNMYWAITALPTPLINLREALEWEAGVPLQIFPFLRDPETAQRTPEEWRRLMMGAYMKLNELSGQYEGKPGPLTQVAATALMMKGYPIAKKNLIASGMTEKEVEAMSVGQVVAIHTARSHRYVYDEMFKWTLITDAPIHDRWRQTEETLRKQRYFGPNGIDHEVLPLSMILMPGVAQAWYAPVRLERQFAALRLIEAIRMHADANGGSLPTSLNEIKITVVPNDPLYDIPFTYKVDGDTAVIENKPRPRMPRRTEVYQYTIRIKK